MKTLKVKILGTELEAPLLNPETAKKYDEGFRQCISRIQNADGNTESGAETLKEQCNAVIDYIDGVFGGGASKKVFGEETALLTCLDAFEEMAKLYEEQVTPLVRERAASLREFLGTDKKDDTV